MLFRSFQLNSIYNCILSSPLHQDSLSLSSQDINSSCFFNDLFYFFCFVLFSFSSSLSHTMYDITSNVTCNTWRCVIVTFFSFVHRSTPVYKFFERIWQFIDDSSNSSKSMCLLSCMNNRWMTMIHPGDSCFSPNKSGYGLFFVFFSLEKCALSYLFFFAEIFNFTYF